MAAHHPVFIAPADRTLPVWRYMDFTKYVAMLETRALYFARADRFDDRFEGAFTQANIKARAQWYSGPEWDKSNVRELLPRMHQASRKWTYINCWHANEVESAAMWHLYAASAEAIAVRSTFARLEAELPEHTMAGMVEYIDYDKDVIPESNGFYPYLRKRKSFAHEREVRAVRQDPIIEGEKLLIDKENPDLGKLVAVDLNKLVEHVFVAPTAPTWFLGLVTDVTKRYGFNFPISKSSLDADPVY